MISSNELWNEPFIILPEGNFSISMFHCTGPRQTKYDGHNLLYIDDRFQRSQFYFIFFFIIIFL